MQRKMFASALEDRGVFRHRKYCDQVCMAAGMTGVIKVLNEHTSRNQAKRSAKPKCEVCGRNDKRLYVHHKDENPLNNEASNLQTLCGSCHRRAHSPNFMGTPTLRKRCTLCSNPAVKAGLCNMHVQRRRKYGDPSLSKIKIGSEWKLRRVDG